MFHVAASTGTAGTRVDRLLADALGASGISRARLKNLIENGYVQKDGAPLNTSTIKDPSYRVKSDDRFTVHIPAPEPAAPQPQSLPLAVVYEDEALIVIDKPAGLVVHPGAGNRDQTLVNALLAHCGSSLSGIGGIKRPGIVHRLDKETSGLMVVAKNDAAHNALAEQFKNHGEDGRLERTYTAFVWGGPLRAAGCIDAPLGRHPHNRLKQAVRERGGRHARTHYSVTTRYGLAKHGTGKHGTTRQHDMSPLACRLACRLETGRTHQIRVHLAHAGYPVMGDALYGAGFRASANRLSPIGQEALRALGRQALHASVLGFEHPLSGEKLTFESPLPDELTALEKALVSPNVQ